MPADPAQDKLFTELRASLLSPHRRGNRVPPPCCTRHRGFPRFVILDDIGYVKQTAEEAEVLFTLLAERYERRATALTSNC